MISRDSDFIQLRAQVPLQLYVNGSCGQINGLGASFPEEIEVTGLQEKATSKKPSHHQQLLSYCLKSHSGTRLLCGQYSPYVLRHGGKWSPLCMTWPREGPRIHGNYSLCFSRLLRASDAQNQRSTRKTVFTRVGLILSELLPIDLPDHLVKLLYLTWKKMGIWSIYWIHNYYVIEIVLEAKR